jgi:hypothetical protein
MGGRGGEEGEGCRTGDCNATGMATDESGNKIGLALAAAVGVGELTIGIAAGYAAYQVLREGVAPKAVRGL